MPVLRLIETPEQLQTLIQELRGQAWLALDTEFHRERTYRPQLCLLQLCTADQRVALVDAVALPDLTPLLDLLYTPGLIKVLHAARQDLELLYWLRGSAPGDLFDTQLAAAHLGHAAQIGYANLVRERLQVELPKACTRLDWRRRPLPEEALQYAADDVTYLARLYPALRAALKPEQWDELQPALDELTLAETYEPPAEEAWRRVRGAERLPPRGQAVLASLARWRELSAREMDLPRGWLLKDGVLLALARRTPASLAELYQVKDLAPGTIKRQGKTLLRLIAEATENIPAPPRTTPQP